MALREIERVRWIPAWGEERMRSMLAGRPDWCVSRQRVWGVPIPAFYCRRCNREVADAEVIRHVADIFEKESADAWYQREARELLPAGFACQSCGAHEFTKETDILDVWFDSGSSSIAVLENRDGLRWPADVYIEGGDQYRGWFNSSLMVGLAVHDRAPYQAVLTHGWTVDAYDKAMHKSTGNAVSPDEVIKESGADILRLWSASAEFTEDVRSSPEILERVADGYRKIRNTARFALGNLDGFDATRDSIAESEMLEIDRWALAELDLVIARVRAAYEAYEFHTVYHALYDFCAVTLSARYFDILKDRLYTFAPRNTARRSAQTVLYRIADALACLLAPILAFTADEIWENLPGNGARSASVHLAEFPRARDEQDQELSARWRQLFEVRDEVLRVCAAEEVVARMRHDSHSSSAPLPELAPGQVLRQAHKPLDARPRRRGQLVKVRRADGQKCERCWNYSPRVGESSRYPAACERCVEALKEIEAA